MEHPVPSSHLLGVRANFRGMFTELAAGVTNTGHLSAPARYSIVTLALSTP